MDLRGMSLDVPCPVCQYPVWVILAEVAAGITVVCPCCRGTIRLVDSTGSVQAAPAIVQHALEDLAGQLKGMFS